MAYAVGTLSIASGETTTSSISIPANVQRLIIECPETLTGTVTLQGSLDGSTFKAMYSGGEAVTVAANGIHTIAPIVAEKVRLVSGSAEGSAREFGYKLL